MIACLVVILALVADRIFGEPKRFHPLVGFGRFAQAVEALARSFFGSHPSPALQIIAGSLALILLLIPFVAALLWLYGAHWSLVFLIDIYVLYFCLGYNSLKQHSAAVYHALCEENLPRARAKVALIVSRDTQNMRFLQVRKAVIESTLENGADAIFASIFYYLVGGAPLVLAHRLVNTLDAMWGYKTERYNYFGRAAAKFDDLLNYIPARLVAFSYACLGNFSQALKAWKTQAPQWSSPNAGPVMAAGAGALGISLGGKVSYHGKLSQRSPLGFGRAPNNADVKKALALIDHSLIVWCSILFCFSLLSMWMLYD